MAKEKKTRRTRSERRFEPRSAASPPVTLGLGALGSVALGAGAMGQFGEQIGLASAPFPQASWILAGGAVVLGAAIWIGTSGEPALRVGDGGLALEKNGVRRIPWHGLEALRWDAAKKALVATGLDETGVATTVTVLGGAHPQAAAWLLREARARVPAVVAVDGDPLPEARDDAGEAMALDPVQVVGKRCAASGTIVAFEPDARVCPRCERVYHKDHVPEGCACGGALEAHRPTATGAEATA